MSDFTVTMKQTVSDAERRRRLCLAYRILLMHETVAEYEAGEHDSATASHTPAEEPDVQTENTLNG